jgi:hypothetical protein
MQYGQVIPLFVAMKDGLGQTQSLLHTSALENAGRVCDGDLTTLMID